MRLSTSWLVVMYYAILLPSWATQAVADEACYGPDNKTCADWVGHATQDKCTYGCDLILQPTAHYECKLFDRGDGVMARQEKRTVKSNSYDKWKIVLATSTEQKFRDKVEATYNPPAEPPKCETVTFCTVCVVDPQGSGGSRVCAPADPAETNEQSPVKPWFFSGSDCGQTGG